LTKISLYLGNDTRQTQLQWNTNRSFAQKEQQARKQTITGCAVAPALC